MIATFQAMPEPAELRVSDQERERVVAQMREHFALVPFVTCTAIWLGTGAHGTF